MERTVRIAVFSTRSYDRQTLEFANAGSGHELVFFEERLTADTAGLAAGCPGICAFANDSLGAETLLELRSAGVRLITLRSAGFNHIDVRAAEELGLVVARVPEYSPHAVAEHTVSLMLCLNRKLHRAYQRVREQNFSLGGLLGFDMHGKTTGVVGTGRIGLVLCRILTGFGCRVVASDPVPSPECERLGVMYVEPSVLLAESDIVSLHCPLTPVTRHLIDEEAVERMKPGVMLINTSRGAVVDTRAVIQGLKSGRIGSLGLDVYEEEADLFFQDLSEEVIQDDVFARLMTFPNVLITAHQAFFTGEAMANIAATTIENIDGFAAGAVPEAHLVTSALLAP